MRVGGLAEADWYPSTQIGQGKCGLSVSAICRAKQAEEGLILLDCNDLAIALGEPPWSKGEAERHDLTNKHFGHASPWYFRKFAYTCNTWA
ncbi:hypothetical protein AU467_32100 [Mesorhizobium loti]|uniref:Uncharacterized protein n=1 Tax=Rhizobium loti TaxID=381 RepID=A0A101KNB6_RHILI|nr:hypothetical protein AU467_32100 [Mesorhizobium loti]